jgi:hypothetical protein
MAEAGQIGPVEEAFLQPLMPDDVVDVLCEGDAPTQLAISAQRLLLQDLLSDPKPSGLVIPLPHVGVMACALLPGRMLQASPSHH